MEDIFYKHAKGDRTNDGGMVDDREVRDVLVTEQMEDFSNGFLRVYGEWGGAHDGFDGLCPKGLFGEVFNDVIGNDNAKEGFIIEDGEGVDIVCHHGTGDFLKGGCWGQFGWVC